MFKNLFELARRQSATAKYFLFEKGSPGNYNSYNCFDYYKCIFIHIPKTGGVSISRSLFGNLAGAHTTLRKYQDLYPCKTFESYFKFTFVRDPYSRLYSAYKFLRKGGMREKDALWAENNLKYNSFKEFVLEGLSRKNIASWMHFLPQVHFLTDKDGSLKVDFVGKYECLNIDFQKVADRLGLDTKLLHLNRSSQDGDAQDQIYDHEMINIVNDFYKEDFRLLGYDKR